MKTSNCSGFFICAGVLTLALLSGCGGSSSSSTIPSSATVFFAHSAVLKNNNVWTAGYNAFGQLGNGNLTTQATFQQVQGLPLIDRVAAGGDHTLALAFSNMSSVYAWGSNGFGQIGTAVPISTASATNAYSATPIKVPFPGHVTGIAAGAFHSLAIVNDPVNGTGTVYSLGYNGSGQLGDGTIADKNFRVLVQLPAGGHLNNVTEVAAGGSHSLALSNGGVYAWGNNASGQLGTNPLQLGSSTIAIPVNDGNGAALSNIKQIAASGSSSYALENPGATQKLWAWGYNNFGQLGVPASDTPTTYRFSPAAIANIGAGTIIKISAGRAHLLILVDDGKGAGTGTIWALGFNEFSQLGDTTVVSKSVPVQVLGPDGKVMTGVKDIIAFGHQSMALLSDGWYGWGDNGNGQLGHPIATNSIGYLTTPVKIGSL